MIPYPVLQPLLVKPAGTFFSEENKQQLLSVAGIYPCKMLNS